MEKNVTTLSELAHHMGSSTRFEKHQQDTTGVGKDV